MKKLALLLFVFITSLAIVTACNHSNSNKNNNGKNNQDTNGNGQEQDAPLKDWVTVEEASEIIKQNKDNSSFVLLDVRTNSEYKEGHLEGVVQNVTQFDFYSPKFDEWLSKLDKAKRYLIYCRTHNRSEKAFNKLKALGFKRIQYIKGGFTEWADKGFPTSKPKYKKAVDVLIKGDKIKTKDSIKFDFSVTDLDGDPLRKAKLSVKILSSNDTEVVAEELDTDDRGEKSYTFNVGTNAQGAYRLVCTGKHKDKDNKPYEEVTAYYYFEIASENETVSGTSNEITITHDITKEMADKFYNRNIYGYNVYNKTKELIDLKKPVTSGPVLIAMVSPLCGGCMVKVKELLKYNLAGVTFIPLITSVSYDLEKEIYELDKGIEETEASLTKLGLADIIPNALYDAKDEVWFSRFHFITTPKFILINKDGQIKDIIHGDAGVQRVLTQMSAIFNLPAFNLK
ncbi:MAG: rhodanese-like domain-containing protein [Treponema sp.]